MIGIGVGIDYALFIVTRYRQGLGDGLDPHAATVRADRHRRARGALRRRHRRDLAARPVHHGRRLRERPRGRHVAHGRGGDARVDHAAARAARVRRAQHRQALGPRHAAPRETAGRQSMWFRWSRVVQHHPWISAARRAARPRGVRDPDALDAARLPRRGSPTRRPTPPAGPTTSSPRASGPASTARSCSRPSSPRAPTPARSPRSSKQLNDTPGRRVREPAGPEPVGRRGGDPGDPDQRAAVAGHRGPRPHAARRRDPEGDATAATSRSRSVASPPRASTCRNACPRACPWFIGAVLFLSFLLLMAVFRSLLVPLKAVIMNLLSIGAAYGARGRGVRVGLGRRPHRPRQDRARSRRSSR